MGITPEATFAEVLRQARLAAQLTQEELALRSSVAARTISDLERGKATMPHADTVLRLAEGLKLTGEPKARFEAAARGRAYPELPGDATALAWLLHGTAAPGARGTVLTRLLEVPEMPGMAHRNGVGEAAGVDATGRSASGGARPSVIDRLQRGGNRFRGVRILWVDDHPENNVPVMEFLHGLGAAVDAARSNAEAFALANSRHYDLVISDVARDDEGEGSSLKGVELAEELSGNLGLRTILFTAYFDPATLPGTTVAARLNLTRRVQQSVFAVTREVTDLLHSMLDALG